MEFLAILTLLVLLGAGLHLIGGAMLALGYSSKDNQYPVSRLFVVKWILITGFPGLITSGDEENGLFRRGIQDRMDADRTNAGAIATCKANLRELQRMPGTNAIFVAIAAEKAKLKELRAFDNEVASAIGIQVLAEDLEITRNSVAGDREILGEIRDQTDS